MSYSYSGPLTYNQQNAVGYNYSVSDKKNMSVPVAAGGFIAGGTLGGIAAGRKVPYFNKSNDVKDTFAESAYKRYIKKAAPEAEKQAFEQKVNVIKKISKVKNVEELRALLNNNPLAKSLISDELLNSINETNLGSNKATIKNTIQAKYREGFQDLKNKIIECWNSETKKFVKPDGVNEETFKVIKKSAQDVKANLIGKYILIAGALASVVALAVKNAIDANKFAKPKKTV